MKQFYHHIIEIETIYTILDVIDLEDQERKELIVIIESTVHHTVMDTILSELSEKDKKIFLAHYAEKDHDKLWKHVNEKIDKIGNKINKAINLLLKELHEDIYEAKKRNY